MAANWSVTSVEQRETMLAGARFVKGYDVSFVEHSTSIEGKVFVPDADFLGGRTAQYIQPHADAIAATVGSTG